MSLTNRLKIAALASVVFLGTVLHSGKAYADLEFLHTGYFEGAGYFEKGRHSNEGKNGGLTTRVLDIGLGSVYENLFGSWNISLVENIPKEETRTIKKGQMNGISEYGAGFSIGTAPMLNQSSRFSPHITFSTQVSFIEDREIVDYIKKQGVKNIAPWNKLFGLGAGVVFRPNEKFLVGITYQEKHLTSLSTFDLNNGLRRNGLFVDFFLNF